MSIDPGDVRAMAALEGTGICAGQVVRHNLPAAALMQHAIRRGEGTLSIDGALIVRTGARTGRSVADKFIVDEPQVSGDIWWGKINQRLAPAKFGIFKGRVQAYLQGQELFVQDLYASSDPDQRVRVRLVSTGAWQALFARHIFIHPPRHDLHAFRPDYVILHAPRFHAQPEIDGVHSYTSITLSFAEKMVVIAGTEYAGEIKKSIFTVMNWLLPPAGVLPMHCSANVGAGGDVALFFGLSGTGKTTLSSDPLRPLIGDDEHGWGPDGVFNIEGGCYAKVIDLSQEAEPEIWAATHRFATVLENVVANQLAAGVGGQGGLAGAGQAEEQRDVALGADVRRTVHRQHALGGEQPVHDGEDGFLDLAGIFGAGDEDQLLLERQRDGRCGTNAVRFGVRLEQGGVENDVVRLEVFQVGGGGADEHVAGEQGGPGAGRYQPDFYPMVGIGSGVEVLGE